MDRLPYLCKSNLVISTKKGAFLTLSEARYSSDMNVYGIDFTSAPGRKKPITCARCELSDSLLRLVETRGLIIFKEFENLLESEGTWIAGIDFPFGQPRKLVQNLGWSLSWDGYVGLVGTLQKGEWEDLLTDHQAKRPQGAKHHLRETDKRADLRSPMMLVRVPVGKMFFQGAPRLLKSRVNVVPCRSTDSKRIVVEAYPKLVAQKWVGNASYKNDSKKKQTQANHETRQRIIDGLSSKVHEAKYGFNVGLTENQMKLLVDDPMGDSLDGFLCAIQAAWAYERKEQNFGIPLKCDPLEGWIVDPYENAVQDM